MKHLLIILLSICLLCGCVEDKFKVGQLVKHKLDNRIGMIVRIFNGCILNYQIRFVCNQITTDTHLISNDDPIRHSPYALVDCAECELILYEKEK